MKRPIHLLTCLLATSTLQAQSPSRLDLSKGDSIALIGGGVADRQQHHGWLETMVYQEHPEHDLVMRNLGFAGDEVALRMRSENFGTPEEWLTKIKADVVMAFFGFNESFQGEAGLSKFKTDLETFLKETKAKNYSGKTPARVVLFSPLAFENVKSVDLPDGAKQNENLKLYTAAMAEVAQAQAVQFVDLFAISQRLFAQAAKPLTFNGIHLTEEGERAVAAQVFQAVFSKPAPNMASLEFGRIREAVLEKNAMWHSRYRTVDGYNVYGGRSALAYAPNVGPFKSDRTPPAPYISNYKVMQEEMAVRDVMTSNRDKRVWGAARGINVPVDDSNIPPVTPVLTNKPGTGEGGKHVFLDGEEAIAKMTVPQGCKVNLFADEKQFPGLANPVQMAWDTKGRLWVASWVNYPERTPWSKEGDSLMVFEDTNADGRADKVTKFLDDLNCPTGFQFYKDGVLVMQAPDLWFVRDADGDGRGDWKERVLMGLDSADSHHTTNAMCLEPGGATYLSDGVFHRTQVETINGPVRNADGAIYRYEPRTQKFERYMPYGFANPHGRVFDRWGNDIITDATGNANYFAPASSGFIDEPHKHSGMKEFWNRPSRPCAGTGILSSSHFPDDFNGNFLNANVISIQGIFRVKVSEDGSGLKGETLENLVTSTDPNFRPTAVSVGPDGAVYFCDWHNPIIGHMQHHIRDQNRDHHYGRVYRITYEGRELLKPAKIAAEPIEKLLELLKSREDGVRTLAKVELDTHETAKVIAATKAWIAGLDTAQADYEHQRLEGLWVHQWHNVVDLELLGQVLKSPDHRARAQAVRVLCYWRDRVPNALELLRVATNDSHPRVRLEAVRACSFFRTWEAADVALQALKHPSDYYIDYCLKETMRQLEQWWKPAISEGKALAADNPQGVTFILGNVNTADLTKLPRTEAVLTTILTRPGLTELDRLSALADLATMKKTGPVEQLLAVLEPSMKNGGTGIDDLSRILTKQNAADLKSARGGLVKLLQSGGPDVVRSASRAAIALADGSLDAQWQEAGNDPKAITDVLRGVSMISDASLRATAYAKVKGLLDETPPALREQLEKSKGTPGRYVRIELPRRGTLTLAEVEVISGGRNVATGGKAEQSSTANHGTAARAIDGKIDGVFGSGTLTHTSEGERNPWWEVDLQSEYPVESIRVWNRTEGNLGRRLEGFTLTVLDGNKRQVFQKTKIPAPEKDATVTMEADSAGGLRRAAIQALVSTGQDQPAIFGTMARLITTGTERNAAAAAMAKLPRTAWAKDSGGQAAKSLVEWAKTVPATGRTAQEYVETVQVAKELAGLLGGDEASALRKTMRELSVSVYVVKTVREQLRFDTTRLVVEAGKPFELIFENDDMLPHNLLIIKPGTKEKVTLATMAMLPSVLDNRGRAYMPPGELVIDGTKMLEPGQKETLKLTAPTEPGELEFICTFPGHATVMQGQIVVSKDGQ